METEHNKHRGQYALRSISFFNALSQKIVKKGFVWGYQLKQWQVNNWLAISFHCLSEKKAKKGIAVTSHCDWPNQYHLFGPITATCKL